MVCPKCGKESNNNFKFCTQCGYNFSEELKEDSENINVDKSENIIEDSNVDKEIVNKIDYSNQNGTISNDTGVVRKKHTGLIIGLIALLVIAVVVIVILLLWKFGDKDEPSSINNLNNSIENSLNGNNNANNSNNNNTKGIVTKYDNYDVDVTMKMELAGVEMVSVLSGAADEVNQTEHFKISVTSLGMTVSMESYSDFKNGYTYISEPIFGGWTRYSEAEKVVDLNSIVNSLINSSKTTKIDDNHYRIVISSDTIEGIMDTSDIDYNLLDGDVNADVYLNNGNISKIVYDMGEMMKGVSSFTLEMEISNYNNAGSVVIPDEVIKSATESKW